MSNLMTINKNHLQLVNFDNLSLNEIQYIFPLSDYRYKRVLTVEQIHICYDDDFIISIQFDNDTVLNIHNKNFLDYAFYYLSEICNQINIIDSIVPCTFIDNSLFTPNFIIYKNYNIRRLNIPDTDYLFNLKWTIIPILLQSNYSLSDALNIADQFLEKCTLSLKFNLMVDTDEEYYTIRLVSKFLPKYIFNNLPKKYSQYVDKIFNMSYFRFPNEKLAIDCLDYLSAREIIYKMNKEHNNEIN